MDIFTEFKQLLSRFGLEYFNKYYGIYRGFVHDNEDPDFLGRLKLKVPQIYGPNEHHDYWAWSKGMFAGKQIGLFAIPNIGDGVWVSFENGDPRFPIWEYGWFGTGDVPDDAKNNGKKPTNMIWQSTSGQKIELDDKDSKIRITQSNSYWIELSSTGIKVGDKNGNFQPVLLGNDWKSHMDNLYQNIDSLYTAIEAITVLTSTVPSTPPVNVAQFAALQIQAQALKAQLPTLLSQKVKVT